MSARFAPAMNREKMLQRDQLACEILERHFGEDVKNVLGCMISCEAGLSLRELVFRSQLPEVRVQDAVVQAIQHGLVRWHVVDVKNTGSVPFPSPLSMSSVPATETIKPTEVVLYQTSSLVILRRLRHPIWIKRVKDELGDDASLVFSVVLTMGICTRREAVQVTSDIAWAKAQAAAENEEDEEEEEEEGEGGDGDGEAKVKSEPGAVKTEPGAAGGVRSQEDITRDIGAAFDSLVHVNFLRESDVAEVPPEWAAPMGSFARAKDVPKTGARGQGSQSRSMIAGVFFPGRNATALERHHAQHVYVPGGMLPPNGTLEPFCFPANLAPDCHPHPCSAEGGGEEETVYQCNDTAFSCAEFQRRMASLVATRCNDVAGEACAVLYASAAAGIGTAYTDKDLNNVTPRRTAQMKNTLAIPSVVTRTIERYRVSKFEISVANLARMIAERRVAEAASAARRGPASDEDGCDGEEEVASRGPTGGDSDSKLDELSRHALDSHTKTRGLTKRKPWIKVEVDNGESNASGAAAGASSSSSSSGVASAGQRAPPTALDVFRAMRLLSLNYPSVCEVAGEQANAATVLIDFDAMGIAIRADMTSRLVRDRYGTEGRRVFEMLRQRGKMDQKQVAEDALLNQKMARELVYSMFKDEFLCRDETPRGNDSSSSRTFYFFRVDDAHVAHTMTEHLCRSIRNVATRSRAIAKKNTKAFSEYHMLRGDRKAESAKIVQEVFFLELTTMRLTETASALGIF